MRARNTVALLAGASAFLAIGAAAQAGPRHPAEPGFAEEFHALDAGRWQVSDGWSNGRYMSCTWSAANTAPDGGRLRLAISEATRAGKPFSCGEVRTTGHYGYGSYRATLKAARLDGVRTAFSTYTGPPFGDAWDEISIAVNGKDTTRVEVNYVAKGAGRNSVVIELGFDAAQGFHTFGFDWQPDRITWTVDGRPVHSVRGTPDTLPSAPGRIYLHTWSATGSPEWLKGFAYPGAPVIAEVERVAHEDELRVAHAP